MQLNTALFRGADHMKVASSIVEFVQELYEPDNGWTIESGLDCISVLLLAARMAYPTADNISELLARTAPVTPPVKEVTSNIVVVSRNLADQIEAIKRELSGD